VSEFNLARSLFSAKDAALSKKPPGGEAESAKDSSSSSPKDRDPQALYLEIDILQKNVAKWESEHQAKCEYIELLEKELVQKQELLDSANPHGLQDLQACQQTVQQLQKQLSTANTRKEEVEAQLAKQNSIQARLQQAIQLVEAEHVTTKSRMQDLEQQTSDLQEQVLQQACQTAEYEAAIQHWKDKALHHQRHALQLSTALDRFLESKGEDVKVSPQPSESVAPVAIASERRTPQPPFESYNSKPTSPVIGNTNGNAKESRIPNSKIELPAFLVRQR
jgi:chromosome segregation ATPase